MSYLTIDGLSVAYGGAGRQTARTAVDSLSLAVPRGQLVSLLGPSGCGKTTTMRAVAGLLAPKAGRIVLDGRDITRLPPHKRDIGLVFQSYALFPHLSVFDNVAFGLRLRRVQAAELQQRTQDALASVGLADLAGRLPAQLSGGQQQRVALARALVIRPRLLLLDEPLSNLDARLRVDMRAELRRLQREWGITMLYVTHDQEEALSLSDRIVVMRDGRIEQDDTPATVYHRPATAFVASFMGYENLFERGSLPLPMALAAGVTHVAWRAQAVAVGAPQLVAAAAAAPATAPAIATAIALAHARPTLVGVSASGNAASEGGHHLAGTVRNRSYAGDRLEFWVETGRGLVKGVAPADAAPWREGDAVSVRLDPADGALIGGGAVPASELA